MPTFPARLHVLMARDARTGVVIRRGPSKSTAVIGWDRRTDKFELGQWVRARIYERRCDLSPDGKWFIYFAMNGRWNSETHGSYTAISRAPYLKAVALFPKGDCWNGGGLFTSKTKYWLNDSFWGQHEAQQNERRLTRDTKFQPSQHYGSECTGVYYVRLQRDGWKLIKRESLGKWNEHTIFEKLAANGWVLRKIAHEQVGPPEGKGCYWDEHQLEFPKTGTVVSGKDWEWADLDGDRLVWATRGELWAAYLNPDGLKDSKKLHDFNGMKFEAIAAPY